MNFQTVEELMATPGLDLDPTKSGMNQTPGSKPKKKTTMLATYLTMNLIVTMTNPYMQMTYTDSLTRITD